MKALCSSRTPPTTSSDLLHGCRKEACRCPARLAYPTLRHRKQALPSTPPKAHHKSHPCANLKLDLRTNNNHYCSKHHPVIHRTTSFGPGGCREHAAPRSARSTRYVLAQGLPRAMHCQRIKSSPLFLLMPNLAPTHTLTRTPPPSPRAPIYSCMQC